MNAVGYGDTPDLYWVEERCERYDAGSRDRGHVMQKRKGNRLLKPTIVCVELLTLPARDYSFVSHEVVKRFARAAGTILSCGKVKYYSSD